MSDNTKLIIIPYHKLYVPAMKVYGHVVDKYGSYNMSAEREFMDWV